MRWLACLLISLQFKAARVQALTGDTVLCSWARHFTLKVALYTQLHNWKWLLVNIMYVYNRCDGLALHPMGVQILKVASS